MSVSHGAVRAAADVLRLPGQIPHPQAAAMPALLLHGALHGGPGGLCATAGKAIIINHPTVRVHGAPSPWPLARCVRVVIWIMPPTSYIAGAH